jgi:hypothetical protein
MGMSENFTSTSKQAEIMDSVVTLYTNGVERLAEAQKKTLDVAQQQGTEMIDACKKTSQGTPGHFFLDLAAAAFGQFTDLQKSAIDLGVANSQMLAGIAKERANYVFTATDGLKARVQEAVDRNSDLQKRAIDLSTTQTKKIIDTFKQQPGVAGTPVEAAATSFQNGVDSIAETQKEFLNSITQTSQTNAQA